MFTIIKEHLVPCIPVQVEDYFDDHNNYDDAPIEDTPISFVTAALPELTNDQFNLLDEYEKEHYLESIDNSLKNDNSYVYNAIRRNGGYSTEYLHGHKLPNGDWMSSAPRFLNDAYGFNSYLDKKKPGVHYVSLVRVNPDCTSLWLALAVAYDEVEYGYMLAYGTGTDGGFGDYSPPVFSQPLLFDGEPLVLGDYTEAKQLAKKLSNEASDAFYNNGKSHDSYDGNFPIEYTIIKIPLITGVFNTVSDVENKIKIMHEKSWSY